MSDHRCTLLIVDDEPYILSTLQVLLNNRFRVLTAQSSEAAQAVFAEHDINIILTDQKMPQMCGVQLLEWVREHSPKTVRLLMTGFAEFDEAVDAINRGQVFRYVFKPWQAEELLETLRSAMLTSELESRNAQLLTQLQELNSLLEHRVEERTAELEKANNELEHKRKELEEANQELEQKNKMLEKLALTDPLTGLPNRRAMDRLCERELRRRDRYSGPLSLALIDVDHFKRINAEHLLPGGDKVLVELAKVLTSCVRAVDFVGRIGGEEFLVIAPDANAEGAEGLGERIRSTVAAHPFRYNEQEIPVRVSIGFAMIEADVSADYEQLKHTAAAALSEAKSSGRNRCVFYAVSQSRFVHAS